jgi:hypothetical protein
MAQAAMVSFIAAASWSREYGSRSLIRAALSSSRRRCDSILKMRPLYPRRPSKQPSP